MDCGKWFFALGNPRSGPESRLRPVPGSTIFHWEARVLGRIMHTELTMEGVCQERDAPACSFCTLRPSLFPKFNPAFQKEPQKCDPSLSPVGLGSRKKKRIEQKQGAVVKFQILSLCTTIPDFKNC